MWVPFLIVLLLALSGPLLIGVAYQHNRPWGALVGALWLLLALIFAGMNFPVAFNFFFSHPFHSVVIVAAFPFAFYWAGPQSSLWQWAARLRPIRIIALRLRRLFHRRGLSRRLAGEVIAMAAAFLVLATVSLLTLRPDPAYQYAIEKLQREVGWRLPRAWKLAEEGAALARERYSGGSGIVDPEDAARAERSITDGTKAFQDEIATSKIAQERIDTVRNEARIITDGARARLIAEMDGASRLTMADAASRVLHAGQPDLLETTLQATQAGLASFVERARHVLRTIAVDQLRSETHRLIEAGLEEVGKVARDHAEAAAQNLLEQKRADIEDVGRKAARNRAKEIVDDVNRDIARVKARLAAEEASRVEADKKRREAAERLRRDQEFRQAQQEQMERSRVEVERTRTQAMARFEIKPGTSYAGGVSLGYERVNSVAECAIACLSVGCEAFAFQTSPPNACYRYKGRAVPFANEYYTGGRLR